MTPNGVLNRALVALRAGGLAIALAGGLALAGAALAPMPAAAQLGNFNPLITAIEDQDHAAVAEALISELPTVRNSDGVPAIVIAARVKDARSVKMLLEAGARPDDRSRDNRATALTIAAENRDLEMIKLLLDNGADPNRAGAGGDTALHIAARGGSIEIAQALIENGANVNRGDITGLRPLEIAQRNRQAAMENLLKQNGAR